MCHARGFVRKHAMKRYLNPAMWRAMQILISRRQPRNAAA
jgi:hypothetical protein